MATLIQLDNLLSGEGDQGLELLWPQKVFGQVAQLQHRLILFAAARDLQTNYIKFICSRFFTRSRRNIRLGIPNE